MSLEAGTVSIKIESISSDVFLGAHSPEDVRKMLELRVGMRPNDAKRHQRPTSAQLYAPSPPPTPALTSHSPTSVRSCPAGPLQLRGIFKQSFCVFHSFQVAICI